VSRVLDGIGLALALAVLAGCAQKSAAPPRRINAYVSPKAGEVKRVMVVLFGSNGADMSVRRTVTDSFVRSMRDRHHLQVLTAPEGDDRLSVQFEMWRRGQMESDTVILAKKQYRCDAFVFGVVTDYKPYDPPVLGLRAAMVSGDSGAILWEAEGLFDASDKNLYDDFSARFTNTSRGESLYGSKLVFMSTEMFAEFVADDLLMTLDKAPGS